MQKLDIFLSSLKHQVWRRYYYLFHKSGVHASLKTRKGECKRCGQCCQASIRCPKLDYDENGLAICKIHDHKPYMCTIYPYNGRDFFKHLKEECGYWYDES